MTKELTANELRKSANRIHRVNDRFGKQFSEWVTAVGDELRVAQELMATHKLGFDAWCQSEFDWSKSRVHQIMDAADTVLLTSTIVDVAPSNEAQCRELLKAPKEDIPEVWRDVVESAAGATITAKMIAERIQKRIDASKPKPPELEAEKAGVKLSISEQKQVLSKIFGEPSEDPGDEYDGEIDPVDAYQQASEEAQGEADARADNLEPVNSLPAWKLQRSKAKKTAEALVRALQDLNDIRAITFVKTSVDDCLAIISELEAMR